jgi:CRISPR-associated protein Cmr5
MINATRTVTRSQRFAQHAYNQVNRRHVGKANEYSSFAKRFPALVHSCGLAQALSFAQAKAPEGFLADLEAVLCRDGLLESARTALVTDYMHLSRETLAAAGWLKRYAEALLDDDNDKKSKEKEGGGDASVS